MGGSGALNDLVSQERICLPRSTSLQPWRGLYKQGVEPLAAFSLLNALYMAITKAKKEAIVEKISGALGAAGSAVFVGFKGLKVSDDTSMRKELRGKDVGYMVAKKTLMRRVLSQSPVSGELADLPGEVALVWGADNLAPAREVFVFEKKLKEAVKILGGIFDGVFKTREEMVVIATIPPREILLGQLVGLLQSPVRQLAVALDQIAQKKV